MQERTADTDEERQIVPLEPGRAFCLVMACDAAYAMPLATSLRSLAESNPSLWPIDVRLLVDSFSPQEMRKIDDSLPNGSIMFTWTQVDLKMFSEYSTLRHVSPMTFARLLIPTVLGSDMTRVLYLDADTLVLGDLRPLWEMDLGGQTIGAVTDHADPKIHAKAPGFEEIPHVSKYFNAGMLLIDLQKWRKQGISEKALTYLEHHPHSPFSDQDALNVACCDRWAELESRWNFQNHFDHCILNMPQQMRPDIIHFISQVKPWKPQFLSLNASLHERYRRRTQYARSFRETVVDETTTARLKLKAALARWWALLACG